MPRILAIESTCDETGAAVVADGVHVLSNVIASQIELHAKYRGVVPEIASRAHIENILPVVRESLQTAGVSLSDIDAVAVAHRPGLIGSLLIGVTAAKSLAWAIQKPLIGVDHVQAHLYSVMLENQRAPFSSEGSRREDSSISNLKSEISNLKSEISNLRSDISNLKSETPNPKPPPHPERSESKTNPPMPAIGLVISGGHTSLYHLHSWTDIHRLGATLDDAVGEAYDKVAAILGLGYPGGPIIDRLAREGDPAAIRFPRTLLGRDSLDFSFSGLKTAVLYHVRGIPGKTQRTAPLSDTEIRDIAASFQAACVDVLVTKLKRAARRTDARSILIGGGVSANAGLRAAVQKLAIPVHVPALAYTTDNAAMTAGLAHVLFAERRFSPLDLDAITYSAIR